MEDIEKIQNDYRSLKRLHDSTNQAVTQLMRENEELRKENVSLRKQVISNEEMRENNNIILQNSMRNSQQQVQDCVIEIDILKKKLKEYEPE